MHSKTSAPSDAWKTNNMPSEYVTDYLLVGRDRGERITKGARNLFKSKPITKVVPMQYARYPVNHDAAFRRIVGSERWDTR